MKYVNLASRYYLNTGTRFQRSIIWSMGLIKYAAAKANMELGLIDRDKAETIMRVSMDVMHGKYDELINIDVYGSGSGTGLNMNINEVISKIIREKYGMEVHPLEHINLGQSSNDVVPSAIRLAVLYELENKLYPSIVGLKDSLTKFIKKYGNIVKAGRTHLRDALPVSFTHVFGSFLCEIEHLIELYPSIKNYVNRLQLGGTAVGTGLNTHPDFQDKVISIIRDYTGLDVHEDYPPRGMKLLTDLLFLSSYLRNIAVILQRMCQDIRLMFSGPNTGFNEIDIDMDLPGSSIMPGKKNPVTAEAIILAASSISGLDATNLHASLLGEFELSMGIPIIGYNIIRQIDLCNKAIIGFTSTLLPNIRINKETCNYYALNSRALITILTPYIGYDKSIDLLTKVANIRDALKKLGYTSDEVDRILNLEKLVSPGFISMRRDDKHADD